MATVKNIEQRTSKNNKIYYVVTTEDGTKATTFENVALGAQGEVVQKGDFKNFVSISQPSTQDTTPVLTERISPDKEQLDRIERMLKWLVKAEQQRKEDGYVNDTVEGVAQDEDLDQDSIDKSLDSIPF